ncbi:cytochrome P450 [Streptomyces sp. NPDC048623]|uniref:cytochrome P450 n=1 Tax=Streptomyces sp. NPDC048623 TaxID=3155761 RepID=UPI0034235761
MVHSTVGKKVPRARGALPVVGHLPTLLRSPLDFLKSLPAQGDVVRIQTGSKPAYVVCTPELTRQVLADDITYDKGGPIFEKMRRVAGDGIGFCPYAKHRPQRKMMQPSFSKTRIRTYAEAMSEEVRDHVTSWQAGERVSVPGEMRSLMSKITTRVIFGRTDLDREFVDSFDERITQVFQESFQRALMPADWLNTIPIRRNVRYEQEVDELIAGLIALIEQRRGSRSDDDQDLLSSVIDFHEGDDKGLGDQLVTLFIGGTGNSAMTLAWSLYLVAKNPHIEAQLHEEVDSVLDGRTARFEDLENLPVVDRVLKETMRLYPSGWNLSRIVTRDTTLGGYELPEGSTVYYSPFVLHHDPELFPDPERFDPDRWLLDDSTRVRGSYIPFGFGARKCIGDHFAEVQMALALASIVRMWNLTSLSPTYVAPVPRVTINPSDFHVRLTPRP